MSKVYIPDTLLSTVTSGYTFPAFIAKTLLTEAVCSEEDKECIKLSATVIFRCSQTKHLLLNSHDRDKLTICPRIFDVTVCTDGKIDYEWAIAGAAANAAAYGRKETVTDYELVEEFRDKVREDTCLTIICDKRILYIFICDLDENEILNFMDPTKYAWVDTGVLMRLVNNEEISVDDLTSAALMIKRF